MNILMVGQTKPAGSWEIRGKQLGDAIGARVTQNPQETDWRWADLVVLVKRMGLTYAHTARTHGLPIVWDALDFWAQPADNGIDAEAAKARLDASLDFIRPALTIGATQAMADDAGGVYLPHHSWRGLEPIQPQCAVTTVVYQGDPRYLDGWLPTLVQACESREWRLIINPTDLWVGDIVVALRSGPWDGWICRQWKSGVKIVNALAAGRPVIAQRSAAATEIGAPGSIVESVDELNAALDYWTDYEHRLRAFEECRTWAPAYRLPAIAATYRDLLSSVEARCVTTTI